MKTIIYHNPRCSKSRQTLKLLEDKKISFEIKEYLKDGLSRDEIESLWHALGDQASKIVRIKEEDFKAAPFSTEDLTTIIKGLCEKPKLLERPIVVVGKVAKIGRPPENVMELFE